MLRGAGLFAQAGRAGVKIDDGGGEVAEESKLPDECADGGRVIDAPDAPTTLPGVLRRFL